jgi:hypothetical protein
MPVRLKIRRMKTNETLVAEFEDLDDAETWLRERPQFVDVIGTIGALGDADDERLRTALRPFDDGSEPRSRPRTKRSQKPRLPRSHELNWKPRPRWPSAAPSWPTPIPIVR